MAGKKDCKMTVMVDDELSARLAQAAWAADVNGSEMVRSCILLALPVFEESPALVSIVPAMPRAVDREQVR